MRRFFWVPQLGLKGPFRMSFFRHITILSGVGVGGGSLVYANTLPVPPACTRGCVLACRPIVVLNQQAWRVIIPRGLDHVEGGDHLLVFCMQTAEETVRDFFLNRLRDLARTE